MPQDATIEEIINYPVDKNGALVTRRADLSRMKPRLNAPPASQPGSVDWTVTMLFGSVQKGVGMIESLVAGQGENADEKWVRFILLYKQWHIQFAKGELLEPPTLNQVCHSLNFEARDFIAGLQSGMQTLMKGVAAMKAQIAVPNIIDNLTARAQAPEADTKDIELSLRVAGVMDDKGGMTINVNQQQAVILKTDKEKQKVPLLQFNDTVVDIDDEVRNTHDMGRVNSRGEG